MLVRSRIPGTLTIMGCRRRPHGSHRPRLGHPPLPSFSVSWQISSHRACLRPVILRRTCSHCGESPPVPDLRPDPLLRRHCRASMGQDYADTMRALFSPAVIVAERHHVLRRVWRRSHRSLPSAQASSLRPALPETSPGLVSGTTASRLTHARSPCPPRAQRGQRTGPATTLLAVQALTALALTWEASHQVRSENGGAGCLPVTLPG